MEEIKNYRLKQLLRKDVELIQEYITLLSHVEAIPTKEEVFYLKLREVQDIKELIADGSMDSLISIIEIVESKSKASVMDMKIMEFFPRINSVIEQVKAINKAEQSSLSSTQPNFKWEAVGGAEKMQKFGIYNTLNKLSNGDITKWESILDLNYADVFTKMYMDTVKGDLDYEMEMIKTQK